MSQGSNCELPRSTNEIFSIDAGQRFNPHGIDPEIELAFLACDRGMIPDNPHICSFHRSALNSNGRRKGGNSTTKDHHGCN